MVEYKSLFADDINAMLKFRVSLGFQKDTYEYNLRLLDRFCIFNYPDAFELTKELVTDFLKEQLELHPGRLGDRAVHLRYFARYLNSIGKPAYVVPSGFYKQKSTFTPYIFTDDELRRLFAAADELPERKQRLLQNKVFPVLFRLIYTCGLRPNEGRELLRKDINLETGELLIRKNKDHKERLIVMSNDMLDMCREYEKQRLLLMPNSEAFFPNPKGTIYTNEMLLFIYDKCWIAANPDSDPEYLQRVRPYDLRHRFASAVINRWLDEGENIYAKLPFLRAYMGHEKLESTLYYVHLLPENLAKSVGINWSSLESVLPEVEA